MRRVKHEDSKTRDAKRRTRGRVAGAVFSAVRAHRGLTPTEVAKAGDMHRAALWAVEAGEQLFRSSVLRGSLAQAYGVRREIVDILIDTETIPIETIAEAFALPVETVRKAIDGALAQSEAA